MRDNDSKSPFFDINNCCDLYKKLENDFTGLYRENMNPYFLMNFLTTSNHLLDWIINDENIDGSVISAAKSDFNFRTNKEFDIIKSLCNRSKHFKKSKYDYEKEIVEGWSFATLDFSTANFGGDLYYILTEDGRKNIYDICEKNFRDWYDFFQKHNMYFIEIGYL